MPSKSKELSKLVASQFGSIEITGDPYLWAFVSLLAKRGKQSLSAWVNGALRVALDTVVPESVETSRETYKSPDWEAAAAEAWKAPDSWGRYTRGQLIGMLDAVRSELEAFLSERNLQSPALEKRRVPQDRRCGLYDPTYLAQIADSQDDDHLYWSDRLGAMGPEREILHFRDEMVRRVERLLVTAPNFSEVTRHLLNQFALARRDANRLNLQPILLVGPPAAGKTWWAEEVAKALGLRSEFVPMGAVSSSWELSGASSSWMRARPGRVLRTFLETTSASPLFILDEVDKISAGNYDPAPVLLYLLDPITATRFRDEFFDMEFDVSRSIFIATANNPERMDPALRSRFREFVVRAPARDERLPIIRSIWQSVRRDRPRLRLPVQLRRETLAVLADRFDDARQIRRLIEDGLGKAAHRAGPLQLLPADVGASPMKLVSGNASSAAFVEPRP